MTNQHPITPPPELVEQWSDIKPMEDAVIQNWVKIAAQAAQWGADQELEACCKWLFENDYDVAPVCLHTARRPKPPSLKGLNLKHLEVMERDGHYLPEIVSDLRRAIESLPD